VRTTAIRIFIADDHPIVRQGLRRIVEADPGMVISGEAGDAAAMLDALETAASDLVLLDVSMPGGPVLETLQALRERHPTIRVLVLSVHPEDQWAVRVLRAGASGYLTKDHSPAQLLEAIRRVHRGGKYVSPTLAERAAREPAGPRRATRPARAALRSGVRGDAPARQRAHRDPDRERARALGQDREYLSGPDPREDGGGHQRRPGAAPRGTG
jgi:DNA-binding NarL/FixJ family response regulator